MVLKFDWWIARSISMMRGAHGVPRLMASRRLPHITLEMTLKKMIGIRAAGWAGMVCAAWMMPAGAGVAAADSLDNPPQVIVKYGDLNLSTDSGAKALYRRMRGAAQTVCAAYEGGGYVAVRPAWRACYDQAMASAVKRIDNRRVTALHEAAGRSPIG